MAKNQTFLKELEAVAQQQAKLNQQRLLPSQLDWFGSLVGNFPWQVLLLASLITAVFLKFVQS